MVNSWRALLAKTAHLGIELPKRRRFSVVLLTLLALFAVGVDILSGPEINFSAGYFLIVAIAAYALDTVWGVCVAVIMLVAQLGIHALVWHNMSPLLIFTTLLNRGIIYAITIVMFVIARDANRLKQENLRLHTLRQTMVTVNDIVFNRLQYFTVLLELAEAGIVPKPRQIEIGHQALAEVTRKLRQLSTLTQVTSYRAAGDIEAVLLHDAPASPERETRQ